MPFPPINNPNKTVSLIKTKIVIIIDMSKLKMVMLGAIVYGLGYIRGYKANREKPHAAPQLRDDE